MTYFILHVNFEGNIVIRVILTGKGCHMSVSKICTMFLTLGHDMVIIQNFFSYAQNCSYHVQVQLLNRV